MSDKIIQLPGTEALPENPVQAEDRDRYSHCGHARITLDEHQRTVNCRDCGRVLDPFVSELLTAAEAAERLRLSARKVYALAAAGELACLRFGSAVRFAPEDVEAYKLKCRSPATPPVAGSDQGDETGVISSAVVSYFGLDRPRVAHIEEPAPTASELRRQRREEKRQREIDRRSLITFHANKRRTAKLKRTPPWADLDEIRAIYAEAQRLTAITGIPHHVDHDIPLQGELVSGLHVHTNLQILTGSENSKKRNRFEVDW